MRGPWAPEKPGLCSSQQRPLSLTTRPEDSAKPAGCSGTWQASWSSGTSPRGADLRDRQGESPRLQEQASSGGEAGNPGKSISFTGEREFKMWLGLSVSRAVRQSPDSASPVHQGPRVVAGCGGSQSPTSHRGSGSSPLKPSELSAPGPSAQLPDCLGLGGPRALCTGNPQGQTPVLDSDSSHLLRAQGRS